MPSTAQIQVQGELFMYRVLSRSVAALTVVLLCVSAGVLRNGSESKTGAFGPLSSNLAKGAETSDANDHAAADASATQDDSLPKPGFTFEQGTTALVVTDPQNDFLSEDGVAWGLVGKSVRENDTIGNLTKLFQASKDAGMPVFISPHYYYPCDHKWDFEGALEE
jgi:hypothetical protein